MLLQYYFVVLSHALQLQFACFLHLKISNNVLFGHFLNASMSRPLIVTLAHAWLPRLQDHLELLLPLYLRNLKLP